MSAETRNHKKIRAPGFFPPLALQRRALCLDVIRREAARSVLDVGCGEGGLLAALCQPAWHEDDFPPSMASTAPGSSGGHSLSQPRQGSSNGSAHAPDARLINWLSALLPPTPPHVRDIHLHTLYGLDIDAKGLDAAARVTAPPPPTSSANSGALPTWERWEPLRVELWQGSLDRPNDAFLSVDMIIASEVFEHVQGPVYDRFASMLLGHYNAKVVVVTTPNYDFNRYFEKLDPKEDEDDDDDMDDPPVTWGTLDPTGRTNRVFRDPDHKFEMTQDEFETWATQAASMYGFDVEFTGCGSLNNYLTRQFINDSHSHDGDGQGTDASDPEAQKAETAQNPAEPPPNIYATQCAIFRRPDEGEGGRSPRSRRTSVLPWLSTTPRVNPHTLRHTFNHPITQQPPTPTWSAPSTTTPSTTTSAAATSTSWFSFSSTSASSPSSTRTVTTQQPSPAPPEHIVSLVESHLKRLDNEQGQLDTLSGLWRNQAIRWACMGRILRIMQAILPYSTFDPPLSPSAPEHATPSTSLHLPQPQSPSPSLAISTPSSRKTSPKFTVSVTKHPIHGDLDGGDHATTLNLPLAYGIDAVVIRLREPPQPQPQPQDHHSPFRVNNGGHHYNDDTDSVQQAFSTLTV